MRGLFSAFFLVLMFFACDTTVVERNPAAEGFNMEASDEKAIKIADAVMEASGTRATWDQTDLLQWNFFGSRLHTWNKATGDLIINSLRDTMDIKMNLKTMTGSVTLKGEEVNDANALEGYMKRGKEMWINDSYWIFLPYKLKDSGVTLKYLNEAEDAAGNSTDVLELTFADVGVTPENKYHIYVDRETSLISQWDFYRNYQDDSLQFSTPWAEYQDYNGLKLSSSRGEGRSISGIKVGADLADQF